MESALFLDQPISVFAQRDTLGSIARSLLAQLILVSTTEFVRYLVLIISAFVRQDILGQIVKKRLVRQSHA